MKVTTGTNCFPFFIAAVNYYRSQYPKTSDETLRLIIQNKISDNEIIIGPPALKTGQEKKLIDGRWHICE